MAGRPGLPAGNSAGTAGRAGAGPDSLGPMPSTRNASSASATRSSANCRGHQPVAGPGSVAEWRERRLSDAMALTDDTLFAQAVARWFAALGQEPDTDILGRLRILQERARCHRRVPGGPAGPAAGSPVTARRAACPIGTAGAAQRPRQAQPVMIEPRQADFFAFPSPANGAAFDGILPGRRLAGKRCAHLAVPCSNCGPHPAGPPNPPSCSAMATRSRFVGPLRHSRCPRSLRLPCRAAGPSAGGLRCAGRHLWPRLPGPG